MKAKASKDLIEWKERKVKVSALKPYERNPRRISEAAFKRLVEGIRRNGYHQRIIATPDLRVIGGHQRIKALKELGIADVMVLTPDRPISEAQFRELLVTDNLPFGEFDFEMLATDFDAAELIDWGMPEDWLQLGSTEPTEGLTDPDEITTASAAVTVLGDTWILGNHRLRCGDSTSITDVEALMDGEKADMVFTDPPYGVSAVGGRTQTAKTKKIKRIKNDNLREEYLVEFISIALSLLPLRNNASFYVCYDHKTQYEFTGVLRNLGWKQKNTIVWNKNVFGLGVKGYRPKYELIAFGHLGDSYDWHGGHDQADVWDINRPTERIGNHPTPKPVKLVETAVTNSSKNDNLVIDPFGGSGSTLIACEKTGRKARLMELDPDYCDVIVTRWQNFTGKKAVHAGTGRQFGEA